MSLDRKERRSIDEELHATFLELYEGAEGEERDRALADVGIYWEENKYFWLFDTISGKTIDRMKIPGTIRYLVEAASDVEKCEGGYMTVQSRLTRDAHRNWDRFYSMAEEWGWKEAIGLWVVEFRDPATPFGMIERFFQERNP